MQTDHSSTGNASKQPLAAVTSDLDDASLLHRWGEGDARAGDELIRRHFAVLHRFLRGKVATDAELEDLVQRTLLACLEARHRYRAEATFRTFLLSIARNCLFDHYRCARRAPCELSSSVRDPATSPTQRLARGQDLDRLVRAIARLPDAMRNVLELSYWGELDVPAISQRLGEPPGTIYSRIHRAKQALRVAFDESADEA
jgi:RNA polymerase sigma-70 factor (ECF subfamily)